MNKMNFLLVFLFSFVVTDIIKADPIKIVSTDGKTSATIEIVGADAKFLKTKLGSAKIPLSLLDRDSLIRAIGELGRQLEASAKSTPRPKVVSKGSTIELRYVKARGKNNSLGQAELYFEVSNTTKFFMKWLFPKLLAYDKKGNFIGSGNDVVQNLRVGQKTVLEFSIDRCRLEEIGSVTFEWMHLISEDQNGETTDLRKTFTPKATNFP